MTVAERMREITRGSVEEQRAKVINNHHKYANRLIHIRDGRINYDGKIPKNDDNL